MTKSPSGAVGRIMPVHQTPNPVIWIWITILVSFLVSASVTWLHFQQKEALSQAVMQMNTLRLARIDLNKGFSYINMAGTVESPFSREQGLALFKQAIDSINSNFSGPDPESRDLKVAFEQSVSDFEDALARWNQETGLNPSSTVQLRIAFANLEQQANLIDQKAQESLSVLADRTNREFFIILAVDLTLFIGLIAIVFSNVRAMERNSRTLRESEEKFRALFQNNHAPMLLVDPATGEINDANPAASSFYGWSYDELIAMKIYEINTLGKGDIKEAMKRTTSREAQAFEFRHRLAGGEIRDVEVYSGPIEHQGRLLLYSIIHDITPRKQAEKALEESENRYRELLFLAPIGIAVLSGGRILFINPAGAKILGGESAEDIVGRFMTDFLDMDRIISSQARLQAILSGESGPNPVEQIFFRLDHKKVHVDLMTAPLVFQEKPAVQVIFSDISARKKVEEKVLQTQAELQRLLAEADESKKELLKLVAQQKQTQNELNRLNSELEERVQHRTAQLEAANRELEAFSYSVSHDLRAPLRGINGWGMALIDDYHDKMDPTARKYLDQIRAETERMGNLIDDLLRLARITRADFNTVPVDLSLLAGEVLKRLRTENPDHDIRVSVEQGLTDQGDRNLLEIALYNLFANAYKFTGKKPQAVIEFGRSLVDGEAVYFIRDNGIGFDSASARNLFGAFQRMHRQSEFPGNGIGLATVKRIILRHGGRIWAESRREEGATFYFTLNSPDS